MREYAVTQGLSGKTLSFMKTTQNLGKTQRICTQTFYKSEVGAAILRLHKGWKQLLGFNVNAFIRKF